MARKRLDVITELYAEAVGEVTEKPESWMAFLKSASRNYRLPFDEQVLIHAQRPDAEAVLTMDGWNKKFGRWVKRDSKGIAVIDKSGSRMKLKYYFDISDTQESRYKRLVRPVPLWEVKEEHREEVKETLANAFDVTAEKEFAEVIKEAAAHAAEDNLTDYMGDMMDALEGSALAGLDGENVAVRAKALLSASIGYMVMARCGLDTETFFDKEDFEGIAEFHAQRLAGIFGTVTSDVAEMALSQISDTVSKIQTEGKRRNRTFANTNKGGYIGDTDKIYAGNERGTSYEKDRIQESGRLSPAGTYRTGGTGSTKWEIRFTQKELSEGTQIRGIPEPDDGREVKRTSEGDTGRSTGEVSVSDGGNETVAESDGGTESERPDEVGGDDEQYQTVSGGYGTEGTGLRIEDASADATPEETTDKEENPPVDMLPEAKEESREKEQEKDTEAQKTGENKSDVGERKKYDREDEYYSKIAFLRADDLLNSILLSAPDIKDRKEEIQAFYESHTEQAERKEYIMRLFRNGITEYTIENGETVGHEPYEDALHVWRGKYEDRTEQGYYHWLVITEIFEGMRLFGKLSDRGIMTTADGQLSLMEEKAGEDTPVFSFPQEFIDHVLCQRGSGVQHGKFRIYSYFLQGHSRTERAEFLKNEYGTGGAGPIITGTGIDEWHDAKGIKFTKGYGDDAPELLLSWGTVAKRIEELIRADRYMTKQEIAFLPEYEKGILSAGIYYFFQNQPDNVIRPYPHRADYSMGMKAIRPQLDMPQRLDTIIQTMAEVLNNTADFARDYPSMQKAYHDILDYKAGTYSLFTPIPDERGGIETLPVPQAERAEESTENETKNEQKENTDAEEKTISEEESAEKETQKEKKENTDTAKKTVSDEAAEKDTEEKEPEKEVEVSETDTSVSESGEKTSLAEKLNDLYKEIDYYGYVQNLELGQGEAEVIRQIEEQLTNPDEVSAIHVYLIDIKKETEPETDEYLKLENMIQEVEALPAMRPPYDLAADTVVFLGTKEYQIDFISEKMVVLRDVEFPLFTEEFDRSVFEERLRENPANDHLKIKEPIPFLPAEKDNILSENAEGFSEKQTERGEKNSGENAEENLKETAQKEEKENRKTDADAEKKGQVSSGEITEKQEERTEEKDGWISESDFPIGAELEMDGRKFAIDSVDLLAGSVSLRDMTFQNGAGFPIFRSESIYVVKDILEKQRLVENLLGKEEGGEKQEEEQTGTTESSTEQTEEIPEEELTTVQKNYRLLMELAPEVLDGEQTSKTFEAGENFMPLTIENAGEDIIAVSHYYMEEDRSMADPDMEFFADHETESLHAMTFKQDNMNIFYNVGASGAGSEELAEELNDFANQWFRNIKDQGYREISPEKEPIENAAIQGSATDDVIPDAEEDKRGQTEQGEPDTAERSDTKITPAFLQKKPKRKMVYDLHPEIPQAERNQFHITDNELGYGTPREKFRKNIMAIQLLKKCEAEDRFATPDEQKILSEYVGWGGLSDAFDETKSSWATEFSELKTVLDEEEYAAARASTLTAFYTPPLVIRAIWQALEDMGLQAGNILEPSCGVGNFIGMKPESLSDCKMYGVEIDSISGRIARQLYQRSSVLVQGYEDAALPDSFFDAAVGNVPFGQFKVSDKRYDRNHFLIHDYFFAKTLDKVRPGGVIIFITSSGTMDKRNSSVRKYIAQRAELLGAVRLPDNTFLKNAGTEVTSDILFLQKRDRMVETEPDWLYLDTDENGLSYNHYFVHHPEMVLGRMAEESSQYGMKNTCKAYEDKDLNELLQEAVRNIHAEITEAEIEEMVEEEDRSIPADPTVSNYSFVIHEGEIWYRENSRMKPVELSVTGANRVRGMIAIRDCVRELIAYQTEGYSDEVIADAQKKLNELYDVFRKRYGLLNDRGNRMVFSEDNSYPLLCSLEILKEDRTLERKADLFTKRTIKPHEAVTRVDTASEALSVSLSEKACVDMEYMCELTGKSTDEIENELSGVIFRLPDAEGKEPVFVSEDEYLSGNVREKLRVAELAAETSDIYRSNVEALKRVQPEDIPTSEISVRLGATWIPTDDIQDFMYGLLETPQYSRRGVEVKFSIYTGEWRIEGKSHDKGNVKATNVYGTKRLSAYHIIEDTLNLRETRIYDYVVDDEGKKKPVLNKEETALAQGKQELIRQEFQNWIWKEPERRQRLTEYYNENFNAIRPREYDGSHLKFYGINPEITLRKHQIDGAARIIYGGNTLLAYVVGAGKTYTMVAAAMESKRLGLCSKSMVVVPNHIIEQFASEWLQLYPSANILVATRKDFETKNRKKFCARIATSEIDAVIIGHSQFEKIPLSVERQIQSLERQMDEIVKGLADAKARKGENFTVKQLEKSRKSLEEKLKKLNDQSRKDDVVTFEELGIDRLFVDEADNYKNLYLYTKMRNVGGIAQTEAQKSSDMFMKCRYLDEITGGKGIIFATGTPVSNSMVVRP